jgi:hypothetical protein
VIEQKAKTAASATATATALNNVGRTGSVPAPLATIPSTSTITAAGQQQSDIDADRYLNFSAIPPISVNYPFDRYRTLKHSLEECGIFTYDDNARTIKEYNDKVNESRSLANTAGSHSINLSNGALVLKCEFPPTLARSALGLGLTETQLRDRQGLLNRWMGELLKSFYRFVPDAQTQLMEFLGLTLPEQSLISQNRIVSTKIPLPSVDELLTLDLQDKVNSDKVFYVM